MPSLAFLTFRGKGSGGGSTSTTTLDPTIRDEIVMPTYKSTLDAMGATPVFDAEGKIESYDFKDYEAYGGERLTTPNDFYSYLTDPTKLNQTLAWGNDPFQASLANATNLASYGGPDDIVSTDANYSNITGADRIGGRQIGKQADATYTDALASQAAKARDSFYRDASVTGVGTGPDSLYKDAVAPTVGTSRDVTNQNINAAQMGPIADIANQNIDAAHINRNNIRNVNNAGVTGAAVAADAFGSLQPQARNSVRDVYGSGFMGGNLDQYMNPYRSQVIDTTMEALDRQRQIQQQQNAASATQAGAFGGSRQGVLEAETNRGFADQAAQTMASLNAQGFDTAASLQQADADRALQAQLANQGMDQAATQQALNLSGQFGLANQDAALRAALANQGVDASTLQFNAGNTQQANMQNAANALAAAQSNQQTQYNQGAFNATNQQQANMQNAANWLTASQANQQSDLSRNSLQAQLANAAGLQNANQQLIASGNNQRTNFDERSLTSQMLNNAALQNANMRFNASANNQQSDNARNLANAQLGNAAALQNANMGFNANAYNQSNNLQRMLANQSTIMDARKSNQATYLDQAKANQAAALEASIFNAGGRNAASMRNAELDLMSQQQALAGNQQLLNNVGFGRDALFQNLDTQLAAGDMVDTREQDELDLKYANWLEEQNYGINQANLLTNAMSGVPQGSQTITK
jgi:hypothetical protein